MFYSGHFSISDKMRKNYPFSVEIYLVTADIFLKQKPFFRSNSVRYVEAPTYSDLKNDSIDLFNFTVFGFCDKSQDFNKKF